MVGGGATLPPAQGLCGGSVWRGAEGSRVVEIVFWEFEGPVENTKTTISMPSVCDQSNSGHSHLDFSEVGSYDKSVI